MKVVCIDASNMNKYGILVEGNIYKVISNNDCFKAYELKEHKGYFYKKERFIPLSEIDETTFERNYDKVKL